MPITKGKGTRNGLQQYYVRINYTDIHGVYQQRQKTAYGKEAAKEMERKLQAEVQESTAANMTVQQLYDDYLLHQKYEIRETSFEKSKGILKRHVLPLLKDYRIVKLDTVILKRWRDAINKKGLAVSTKNGIYRSLNALLNYATRMTYIPRNPLKLLGPFRDAYLVDKKKTKSFDFYTYEEFVQYIEIAREKAVSLYEHSFYTFFCIAFYMGLRKGEIHALKWSDIKGNTMQVRRSIAQKLKGGDRETPPKNESSIRDLQIPVPLMKVLSEQKALQKAAGRFTSDFRICGDGIRCLRDSTVENRNSLFAKEAGLRHIRIHDFRHSHASLLCNEGINIQEIARRLGHSDTETTWSTYAHLYPREEERALNVLNNLDFREYFGNKKQETA